jgi:hypothetical protein
METWGGRWRPITNFLTHRAILALLLSYLLQRGTQMKVWLVEAADEKTGREYSMRIEATDEQEAAQIVRKMGGLPSSIRPPALAMQGFPEPLPPSIEGDMGSVPNRLREDAKLLQLLSSILMAVSIVAALIGGLQLVFGLMNRDTISIASGASALGGAL